MSLFYKSLSPWENYRFQRRKRAFKRGKSCAICGKKYNDPSEMMVAHIVPVRELSDYDALHDQSNWEVRCIYCERRLNHEEDLRRARAKEGAKEMFAPAVVPRYELDIYVEYTEMIQNIWDKVVSQLKPGKTYRRSFYWERLKAEARKINRVSRAKAAAKWVMTNNGIMPTLDEVFDMLMKDMEAKMLLETNGKFKKEKEQK